MNKLIGAAILVCLAAGCSNYEPVPSALDPDAPIPGAPEPAPTGDALAEALEIMRPGTNDLGEERYREAIRLLQVALIQRRHPEPVIRRALGLAYFGVGMYGDAIDELRMALLTNPNDALGQLHLGRAYMQEGNLVLAIEALERSVTLAPNEPETYYHLGMANFELGRFDRAEENLKRAIRLDSDNRFYRGHLAMTYEKQNRIDQALATWRGVLRLRAVRNDAEMAASVRREIERLEGKLETP